MPNSEVEATQDGGESQEQGLQEDVVTKLTTAATLVNDVLKQALAFAIPGTDILSLCQLGDKLLLAALARVYNKKEKGKKVDKGIAFPTTICVNDCVGCFSPNEPEENERILKAGDVVKIELGAHIDGYPAMGGHTIICSYTSADLLFKSLDEKVLENEDAIVSKRKSVVEAIKANQSSEVFNDIVGDKKSNLLKAAWIASEAAIRLMRDGKKSSEVTEVIEKACKEFDCNAVNGLLSYEMKRHVIEGAKAFANSTTSEEDGKIPVFEFQEGEIYNLSIRVSLGDGRCKEADSRPMIYRRVADRKYILKSPLGRQFMSQVESSSPTFPFSLRLTESRSSKVGVAEAMRHELLHAYPVLVDKNGECTATIVSTVIILPSGPKRICGLPFFLENLIKPTKDICDEDLKALLSTSLNKKKQKKKEKKEEKREDN